MFEQIMFYNVCLQLLNINIAVRVAGQAETLSVLIEQCHM